MTLQRIGCFDVKDLDLDVSGYFLGNLYLCDFTRISALNARRCLFPFAICQFDPKSKIVD